MSKIKSVFKKFTIAYIALGMGICIGSGIGTIITYSIMSLAYGAPDSGKILQITDCLRDSEVE
tara:strand:- start:120 stop:308 length:189 start_codon:yes stop_codon:yes gene_type:complete